MSQLETGSAGIRALPFAGLGFDMSGVAERAMLVVLRLVRPCGGDRVLSQDSWMGGMAGYDLLIRLSREIRGR